MSQIIEKEPPKTQNLHTPPSLGAIFGAGRSGTTWLGAMLSSHPDVAYRFEPFHRLNKTNMAIANAFQQVSSEDFSFQDLDNVHQALLPAFPEIDKPPFFRKNYASKFPFGRALTWGIAKKTHWGRKIFSQLYTPTGSPTLIFKEVALIEVMTNLINTNRVPIVYLLRHPCAVVSSTLRGQKDTLMPSARRSVLPSLLATHLPHLAAIYGERVLQMDVVEQEALLWLVDVERAMQICQDNDKALVIVYEQLVEQPVATLQQVFNHFGLTMNQQSREFIQQSSKSSLNSKIKAGEIGINQYFSVYRDSQSCRDRWKQELTPQQIEKVLNIVRDSQGYGFGSATGFWL